MSAAKGRAPYYTLGIHFFALQLSMALLSHQIQKHPLLFTSQIDAEENYACNYFVTHLRGYLRFMFLLPHRKHGQYRIYQLDLLLQP